MLLSRCPLQALFGKVCHRPQHGKPTTDILGAPVIPPRQTHGCGVHRRLRTPRSGRQFPGAWSVLPPISNGATRFSPLSWSTELKLPIESCSLILSACNASTSTVIAGVLPSQAASTLLANRAAFRCGVPPLDSLINGGLKKGEVLAISGPPGSGKTQLALAFVKEAVRAGDEVLVIGTLHVSYRRSHSNSYHRLSEFCAAGTDSSCGWGRHPECSSGFDT
jgi:hypothetical protein